MKIEIRADGAHISGYVNVTEKKSRPVITPHGRVIEEIEPRAFEMALARATNVPMTVDHGEQIYAETGNGTLKLHEDNIGLYADATVTDDKIIAAGKAGKIRGWSIGMKNVQDELEQRANELPLRKVKAFALDHITLVINKIPCYSATSVELRADEETTVEIRSMEEKSQITVEKPSFDNSAYHARIKNL